MRHFIVIFFLVSTSCSNPRIAEQKSTTDEQLTDGVTQQNRVFEQPVDLYAIKNLKNTEFTSGGETKTCEIETEGFFGSYGFIDMEEHEPFANLLVLTTDQPEKWRADSKWLFRSNGASDFGDMVPL